MVTTINNQDRLANADIPGVSRTDYGYDWVGNRTSPTAIYNDADQLTSYNGNTYSYDTNGNMTSGAGRTYSITTSGKVYSTTYSSVTYANNYDASGNRSMTNNGGAISKYAYDITTKIPAMISEGPTDGSTSYYYIREPGGELVMRQNGTDQKYYHFDELGSTLFLTDASGVQTDKYVYNAWGKVVSSSGTTVNPYKFVGQLGYYSDTGTGLILLGARFYDPEAGVFTQRDTAKDGRSHYSYSSGHPLTGVDPSGNIWCKTLSSGRKQCYLGTMPVGETGTDVPIEDMNQLWGYLEKANSFLPPCRRLNLPELGRLFELITTADTMKRAAELTDIGRVCSQIYYDHRAYIKGDGSGGTDTDTDPENPIWRRTIRLCNVDAEDGHPRDCSSYADFVKACTKYTFGCDAAKVINDMIGMIPYMQKPWWHFW